MKRLLLLLCCTLSLLSFVKLNSVSAATASRKSVVLLVSLDPNDNPKGLAGLFHNYKKYPAKLAATFNSMFAQTGFDVQVVQNADRFALYQALHSPNNVGVFWVSHETPIQGKENSVIEVSSVLLDHQLSDVKSLFEEMNPNIRWVSLVACDSELVINWLKGDAPTVENAKMQGFNTPVDANQALKSAISRSRPTLSLALSDANVKTCPEIQGQVIGLRRELRAEGASYFPSLSVTVQGSGSQARIIAAFPEAYLKDGEILEQNTDAVIPEPVTSLRLPQLSIVADSGLPPIGLPKGFQMGTLSVTDSWPGAHWSMFARNGVPLGVTQEILKFDGEVPADLSSQTIEPTACR